MNWKLFSRRAFAASLSLALLLPTASALDVEQAGELLQELYVDGVSMEVLQQPTIDAMLEALGDHYTQYFTPEEYQTFLASMSDQSLVGVGIYYTQTAAGLLLSGAVEGSPAQKAGLKSGDLVTAVDGKSVTGDGGDDAVASIRGEEGTQVALTYTRDGAEHTVTLQRAAIVVLATTTSLLDGHIGYIKCTTFGNETLGHFKEGMASVADKTDGWIVDLRSNGGGVTQASADSAGQFTGAGTISYFRDKNGSYGAIRTQEEAATLSPAIVLVDQNTASASEIFSSAIKDRGAGIVIGTRTFGKGVAQSLVDQSSSPDYFPDGDAIKITSARFFSPNGNTTDQVGVIPNLLVDDQYTLQVAQLLSASNTGDTRGALRVDIGWHWIVDLKQATSAEYKDAFLALLEALPVTTPIWLGTGGADGWSPTTAAEVAKTYSLAYAAPTFPDQADSDYDTPLSILKTYDIVRGKEDGGFHPQDTLTRAEFCQMLGEALNCKIYTDQTNSFSDVPADAWYSTAVTALSSMGVISGNENGEFRPEDPMDDQQFITIMGRLAKRLNMDLYSAGQLAPENTDAAGLAGYADWARESAWLMSYSQENYFGQPISLLWDDAENIDPTAHTTRDQAAYTIYRLLNMTQILPA